MVPTSLNITAGEGDGGAGGRGGALVTLTTTKGVSSFATPVNYGEFPQPFSGLDEPVVPYERCNSRSSGCGFAASDDGGGSEHQEGGGGGGGGGFSSAAGGPGVVEGGREEGWTAPPEIDVTDLVMDNNEFYTPHGDGGSHCDGSGSGSGGSGSGNGRRGRGPGRGKHCNNVSDNEALRAAVVMVAVAAAETKALRRKSSCGAGDGNDNGNGGFLGFDYGGGAGGLDTVRAGSGISVDTRSSAENTDNGPPSASEDRRLAAAAIEAATIAAAAVEAELSREGDPGPWDAGPPRGQGASASKDTAPSKAPTTIARRSSGSSVTFEDERGVVGGPATPGSLPGLLSMSFSTSLLEEGFGRQQLSPNSALFRSQSRASDSGDNDKPVDDGRAHTHLPRSPVDSSDKSPPPPPPPPPPALGVISAARKQLPLQKLFKWSSSRYSSDFEDGSALGLPPLPETGGCGRIGGDGGGGNAHGSVRYPFLENANTGAEGNGSGGRRSGLALLSRIPSSMSSLDSSEDEADALAVVRTDKSKVGVAGAEHAPAGCGGRGAPGENGRSVAGGTGEGGTLGEGGSLRCSVGNGVDQGTPRDERPSSFTQEEAAAGMCTAEKPSAFNSRTLRKIKSIDEGSDEQERVGSSSAGLFSSASMSSTARFFRSGGGSGGGGGGGAGGVVSEVLGSCVALTPPATPNAAAAAGDGGRRARNAAQQANNFDSGRLTGPAAGWPAGGGGGGGGADSLGDNTPGDTGLGTGPFFLWGGARGVPSSRPPAPREREGRITRTGTRAGARAGAAAGDTVKVGGGSGGSGGGSGGGDGASTGLFDSTKRWFDSVSTVIVGGGAGSSSRRGGGQNIFAVEPSLDNTE